jgi:hypothetical protein
VNIQHLSADTSPETVAGLMKRDGAVIVDQVISTDEIDVNKVPLFELFLIGHREGHRQRAPAILLLVRSQVIGPLLPNSGKPVKSTIANSAHATRRRSRITSPSFRTALTNFG